MYHLNLTRSFYEHFLAEVEYKNSAKIHGQTSVFTSDDKITSQLHKDIGTLLTALSFITLLVDTLSTQVFGMICYTLGRTFVFAMFYINIGRRLGYHNIGTLVGIGSVTSAMLSFLQYPMVGAASSGFLKLVNVACAAVVTCLLPYCVWLGCKESSECKIQRESNSTEPPSIREVKPANRNYRRESRTRFFKHVNIKGGDRVESTRVGTRS